MKFAPALLGCCFVLAASAQSIGGRVFDGTGAVVPGARVVLLQDFNKVTETKAGDSGEFAFQSLKPGTYQVQIKQPTFNIFQQLVQLDGRRDAQVWATLEVARATDELTIASDRRLPGAAAFPAPVYKTGGKVAGFRRISGRMPAWPEAAAARVGEARVVLCGTVKTDGSVAGPVVLEASAPEFAKSAMDAYTTWKFAPMTLNGQPVEARHLLVLLFEHK